MPITRVGDYFETDDLGIVKSLGIETSKLRECVAAIRKRKIQGVFGCPAFGFKQDNLDFLAELTDIRQVWFWEVSLKKIDALYTQTQLEYFGIHPKRPPVNFSQFKYLRTVVWQPVRNDDGIAQLSQLNSLDIWRYNPKNREFSELSLPTSLRKLEFNWCNEESIESLQTLPNLEELQFHYCRNLRTLSGLARVAPSLKRLVVTRCANLEFFDDVVGLPLEHLYINIRGKTVANKSLVPTPGTMHHVS